MGRPSYKDFQEYKQKNIDFLEENLKNDDVNELPCGVQYKVLLNGRGPSPKPRSKVKVHYKGSMIDGTVFDDSFKRKCPELFRIKDVIKGFQEALKAMQLGSRWIVYIPYELGYGSKACGEIKAYSTLIFEIELLGIK